MIKYFPFAPGIPWRLKNGYIVPKIDGNVWEYALDKRDIVVVCFGGLFESFLSLSYLEVFNFYYPNKKLFWAGYSKYYSLVKWNGLASTIDLDDKIGDKYPIPIFLDKKDKVYFNCLNNYVIAKSFNGKKKCRPTIPATMQVARNLFGKWSDEFLPKLRNFEVSPEYSQWDKLYKISSYICIFPDSTELSIHKESGFRWDEMEVKSLASILKVKGITTIVFTEEGFKYNDSVCKVVPLKLDYILNIISKAKAILSNDIDFLFLGNLISSGILMMEPLCNAFNLKRNNKFLGDRNVIYVPRKLLPKDVADWIK